MIDYLKKVQSICQSKMAQTNIKKRLKRSRIYKYRSQRNIKIAQVIMRNHEHFDDF